MPRPSLPCPLVVALGRLSLFRPHPPAGRRTVLLNRLFRRLLPQSGPFVARNQSFSTPSPTSAASAAAAPTSSSPVVESLSFAGLGVDAIGGSRHGTRLPGWQTPVPSSATTGKGSVLSRQAKLRHVAHVPCHAPRRPRLRAPPRSTHPSLPRRHAMPRRLPRHASRLPQRNVRGWLRPLLVG